jgi:hypothetical protein
MELQRDVEIGGDNVVTTGLERGIPLEFSLHSLTPGALVVQMIMSISLDMPYVPRYFHGLLRRGQH